LKGAMLVLIEITYCRDGN